MFNYMWWWNFTFSVRGMWRWQHQWWWWMFKRLLISRVRLYLFSCWTCIKCVHFNMWWECKSKCSEKLHQDVQLAQYLRFDSSSVCRKQGPINNSSRSLDPQQHFLFSLRKFIFRFSFYAHWFAFDRPHSRADPSNPLIDFLGLFLCSLHFFTHE